MASVEMKITVVAVGDGAVGKTSMLVSYAQGHFPTGYVPTVFDNYNAIEIVGGRNIEICLIDTAGQEAYDQLRLLSYKNVDITMICFDTSLWDSLDNVVTKWAPEVKENCPNKPLVLVGTKIDKRKETKSKSCVSTSKGKSVAKQIGAVDYLECSALTSDGLTTVFSETIQIAVNGEKTTRIKEKVESCCVLV